jgi:uncharacterized protein
MAGTLADAARGDVNMRPMTCRFRLAPILALALLTLAAAPAAQAADAPPLGEWQGRMVGLRIVLHVGRDSAGVTRASLDSPDQGATGLPVDGVTVRGDSLFAEIRALGVLYSARMLEGGDSLSGVWRQGPATLPLGMRRGDHAGSTPRRPQTPKPPFPYTEEAVTVRNPAAPGVSLAGTLTLPAGKGPFPAVVLITGSGQQDRDETIFGHKPFLVLADFLSRRGFAVLRADDRGVGGSTGPVRSATSVDFAGDIQALVDHLARDARIDPRHIALVGHSEGGLIAPMVATRDPRVAAIVLLSGPGVPGDSLVILQGSALRRAAGMDSVHDAQQALLQRRLIDIVHAEPDSAIAHQKMVDLVVASVASMPAEARAGMEPSAFARSAVRGLLDPWMRFFLAYDPRPVLMKVRCPVLALGGGHDLQVPPAENLPAIEQALRRGGNRDFSVRELPGLNHLFQTSSTGSVGEYARIEETMAPAALDSIADWLAQRTR